MGMPLEAERPGIGRRSVSDGCFIILSGQSQSF